MDRGRIKIIEFGKEDEPARPASPPVRSGERPAMKVKEFDSGAPAARPGAAAAPPFAGSIKIREFGAPGAPAEPRREARAPALPPRAAMKIVEFGKDAERKPAAAPRRSGMKIVEFD
jgi:hypothetical protein